MDPEHLAGFPLLQALTPQALESIAPDLTFRYEPAGTTIFHAEDPPGDLYILVEGTVEAIVQVDGHELLLSPLEARTFFGGMSFVEQKPRSSAIRARTDVSIVPIPMRIIPVVQAIDPAGLAEFYRLLFVSTSQRLRSANTVITEYFRNVLEKRESEQLEKEIRQLLVHDLRSPLAICEAGLTQLLEKSDKYGRMSGKQKRILVRSRRSTRFLKRLIEEILEVGRSESGQERLEEITIREVLREALTQSIGGIRGPSLDSVKDLNDFGKIRRALEKQDVLIDVSRKDLDASVVVDRFRLIQVVMNLVSNALKHAPGWLAIRVKLDEQRAEFAVVDRGSGIPPEERKTIFELHKQATLKSAGIHRGFGLGLAGAATLVRAMGGTIQAEPGDDGVGTAMVFEIPRRGAR